MALKSHESPVSTMEKSSFLEPCSSELRGSPALSPEQSSMRLSTDKICAGYLLLTGLLALEKQVFGLVLLHFLLVLLILRLRGLRQGHPLRFLYPFLLGPLAYMEVDALRQTPETYDGLVMQWEIQLFGTSPALWMSEIWNSYWVSEFLHLSYLSFYVISPILALSLYRSGKWRSLERFASLTLLTYFSCFLSNMFFPVVGPRHLFPPLDSELQGLFWQLTHWILGQGAAGAAAFPSCHAALGTLVFLSAWRWHRALFWVLAPFCLGLCLATIYGRFHYAVDTLTGMSIAFSLFRLEFWFHRTSSPRTSIPL